MVKESNNTENTIDHKFADLLCVVLLSQTPWRFMPSRESNQETEAGQLMRRIMERAHKLSLYVCDEADTFANEASWKLQYVLDQELEKRARVSKYWSVFRELHKDQNWWTVEKEVTRDTLKEKTAWTIFVALVSLLEVSGLLVEDGYAG